MVSADIRSYFSKIGRKGGQKSRRNLSQEQARLMVAVRLARKAYQDFRVHCFWSYKDLTVNRTNVAWIAEQLRRNGNRAAWQRAARIQALLCP
jgi:hypothetical protein